MKKTLPYAVLAITAFGYSVTANCQGLMMYAAQHTMSQWQIRPATPAAPRSVLGEQIVPLPTLNDGETAVVDGDIPTTNYKKYTVAYMPGYNPILQVLAGFNGIWFQGDDIWANNGSENLTAVDGVSGVAGGATNSTNEVLLRNFEDDEVRNPTVWQENFDYVKTLTRPGQTQADVNRHDPVAMAKAYLDDQRDKGYSLTSGLGPLATAYRSGSDASSPYTTDAQGNVVIDGHTLDILHTTYQKNLYKLAALSDERTGYGSTSDDDGNTTALSDVVTLLQTIADYGASTEAPKYHFESPRPWRMTTDDTVAAFTTISELTQESCVDADGTTVDEIKYYDRPTDPLVTPMKGLRCAARTIYTNNGDGTYSEGYSGETSGEVTTDWVSGRAKDGAFPSGHTAEAFDRGLGFAYAIPQRFAEMVARAADLGENRIVAAMHSPLDVIGGRIMGTAVTAATLADTDNQSIADAAVTQANAYFTEQMGNQYATLNDFAHCTTDAVNPCDATDDYADHQALKKRYLAYMTYGFPPLNEPSRPPEVPKDAEVLLASRLPYLTAAQRRAVLATTEIAANYPVINQSRGWGRLNLVDAADGYGAFNGDVELYMDGSQGGFYAKDRWRNAISGAGRLHKTGTGTLSLEGNNTYSGGTLLDGGTLIAAASTAFGTNILYQNNGTVEVNIRSTPDHPQSALHVSDYVMQGGTLALHLDRHTKIVASGQIDINGALALTVPTLTEPTRYTILQADQGIYGRFRSVSAQDLKGQAYSATLQYRGNTVTLTLQPAR